MKRKKLIMKKRALSWILALTLSGSSLALPVSAAEPDDNVQVETYDETSDFENDADIEITDEGQDANGGASEDINVTEDGSAEDFSDFSDEEATDADIDVFASEEDGQAVTQSGTGTEADPYLIATAADLPGTIEAGTVYALAADITLTSGQQISTIAGTLDGKGHVITLADKPLANSVSGTIQNLGVEGNITLDSNKGSIAVSLSGGTIQNCYSRADINVDDFCDAGMLVGYMYDGTVQNSYYAGNCTLGIISEIGGVVQGAKAGNISNCYYTVSANAVLQTGGYTVTDCATKTVAEFQSGSVTALLNTGMTDAGYYWANPANGGYPVLTVGKAPAETIDWTALDNALADASKLNEADYTETTWSALQEAVAAGNALKEAGSESQKQINDAARAITDAIAALKKPNASAPVALPTDTSKITYITSQNDLSKLSATKDKYYVLENDITINSNYMSLLGSTGFEGVLDGQGHTITFENSGALFTHVASTGVIQNVGFKGSLSSWQIYER